jgi:hypothetical protein
MNTKFYYANGQSITTCRKICALFFGDFYEWAIVDEENLRFIIKLNEEVKDETGKIILLKDEINVQDFLDYWNKNGKAWAVELISRKDFKA